MENTPTILLVDDDPDDLMLLKDAIESLGEKFNFAEANNGRTALNILKKSATEQTFPSLVVLDINMPILDGREMLAIIKSDPILKDVSVVVFSTSSNPTDINYCKQFNVTMFSKPFNITLLKEVAKQIIQFCKY